MRRLSAKAELDDSDIVSFRLEGKEPESNTLLQQRNDDALYLLSFFVL
jgi:hypothetical protein